MLESTKQFTEQDTQLEWAIPGLPAFGGQVILSGASGLGKSLIATEMAVAIATGTPFLDTFRPWSASSVLLLTTEPRERVADRLGCFLRVRFEEGAPLLHISHGAVPLDTLAGQGEVRGYVDDVQPKFVIIDPIDNYFDCSAEGACRLRTTLTQIANAQRVTVVICGDLEGPRLAPVAGVLRSWAQVVLQLREDPARRQVILTTADRERLTNEAPLIRFVIAPMLGKPRYAQLVPWPAEPLSPAEQRVYDQLRLESAPLRELRKRAHIRHEELVQALRSLHAKGLVEPSEGVHRVGIRGRRVFRTWRALPVTARKIDDSLSGERARVELANDLTDGPAGHTTGGKKGRTAEDEFWRGVRAELAYEPDPTPEVSKASAAVHKPKRVRQRTEPRKRTLYAVGKKTHSTRGRRIRGLPVVPAMSRRGHDSKPDE